MGKSYFFCGIGGSGMSALATILKRKGHRVSGSDRGRDNGQLPEKFAAFEKDGIALFSQDGSGITNDIDVLVVSSAVEDTIPDVRQAKAMGVPVRKRAEVLAGLFNDMRGIAVAGTSGKTTVTGMLSHILQEAGAAPTVMNGGQIINFLDKGLPGNALVGDSALFVAETDESDGSIALFTPAIAVLNNITLDHKPLDELRPLFSDFVKKARDAAIINFDDHEAAALAGLNPRTIGFAIENEAARFKADAIQPQQDGISFTLSDSDNRETVNLILQVPGQHNVLNAMAALAAAGVAGISLPQAAKFLESFKGIKRRFEIVGSVNGITVIDDFAHNPDKIEATLQTLHDTPGRVLAVFQPHGFGPTKLLKEGLVQVFASHLADADMLIMPEIYYAGGTAQKDISSQDITAAVAGSGKQAHFYESRDSIPAFLSKVAQAGDRVVIMGARDDTLPDFARTILDHLKKKKAA